MSASHTSTRWVIVVLLLLSVCINYVDRGSLSVAAPLLSKEFTLSPQQKGLLLSAFFWSYAVFQLVSGWLVDRYEVKWVYAGGFCLWSLAMAGTGLATSFAVLFAARLMLGIGESVGYPAISQIVVRHFRPQERGLPNAVIDVGTKVGPALSTLIGGLFVDRYGWRALFLGMGAGALIWLLPWLWLVPRSQSPDETRRVQGPTMMEILGRRETWGTSLAMFALGYVWYFLLTWLPSYLVDERGFSMKRMAVMGSLPFWGMAATTLAGGWISDRWIASGASPTRARKTFVLAGLSLCAVLIVPVAFVASAELAVGLLVAACAALGLFTSNVWAITQTLAGPEAAGKWSGIQNAIGNLGGVVSPLLTGVIVERTGAFALAFGAASTVLVVGVASYVLFVPEVAPLQWTAELNKARE